MDNIQSNLLTDDIASNTFFNRDYTNFERLRILLIKEFSINVDTYHQDTVQAHFVVSDIANSAKFRAILQDYPHALIDITVQNYTQKSKEKDDIFNWRTVEYREAASPRAKVWAKWLLNQSLFNTFMLIIVLIGVLSTIIQSQIKVSTSSENTQRILDLVIFACIWFFHLEIVIKWLSGFREYWNDPWNELDFFATILPDIYVIPKLLHYRASATRLFNLFHIFRLLRTVTKFKEGKIIMKALGKAFRTVSTIFILLAIFMWAFAMAGRILFRKYTEFDVETEKVALNNQQAFSSTAWSFATLFQILTLDRWLLILSELLVVMNTRLESSLTSIFVLAWIWIASFVFQNIFAGVMVNNFHNIRSEMYLKEDNSKFDQQMKNIKIELTRNIDLKDSRQSLKTGSSFNSKDSNNTQDGDFTEEEPSENNTFKNKAEENLANWRNTIQTHLNLIDTNVTEVIWPSTILLDYYCAMIQLQDNLIAQKTILELMNITILQMLEEN